MALFNDSEALHSLQGQQWTAEEAQAILGEADKQGVTALVFDAINRIGMSLSKSLVHQYYIRSQQIIQRNAQVCQNMTELSLLLEQQAIDYVIVKGQVVATYYPHPELRHPGDIDCFCPHEARRAMDIIQKEWHVTDAEQHTPWERCFSYKGVVMEIHAGLFSFYDQRKDTYWQQLQAQRSMVSINGHTIATLAPTIHSIFIFLHLYNHLLQLGIGLRQFCDWAMILHHQHDILNAAAIRHHLHELGMERAYRACGTVLIDYLGLPPSEFPYTLTHTDRHYAHRILDVVFYRGNMGKHHRQSVKGMVHIAEATGVKVAHFAKFYYLAPSYNLRALAQNVKKLL